MANRRGRNRAGSAGRAGSVGLARWAQTALWLALAVLFLGIGLQKLTAYEAFAVAPFARRSPFLAWIYELAGVRGASLIFAAIEIPTGLALAWGAMRPGSAVARAGAAAAAATAFVTTSFVVTAPGAWERHGGVPLLTLQVGQLFAKDLALIAGALVLLAEGLRGRR